MKRNQKGFSAVETLLILIIAGLIGSAGWYVYHTRNSSKTSSNNTANPSVAVNSSSKVATKDYTDISGTYSLKYLSDWTVKEQADDSAWDPSLPPHLKSLPAFTPSNLPAGASSHAIGNVQVIIFKTDDPKRLLDLYRGGGVQNIASKATIIDGYSAAYYQDVQPTAKSGDGMLGYTDDYYAITHNGVTLLFSFREKQVDTSTSSFDSSSIVPNYTALVKSVKFLN